MITVNGERINWPEGKNLETLLTERGYPLNRVAVELDDRIVPKTEYAGCVPKDGSHLEIVCFVGGG